MKLHHLVFLSLFAVLMASSAVQGSWAATPAPAIGPAARTQLLPDPYFGTSGVASTARFVTLCSLPTLDCNQYPDGTPCGDPEEHVFCHCTTLQGTHYCVKNP